MSPTPPQYALRKAEIRDRSLLTRFLNNPAYSHRHLDWRDPLDWLGSQPFWILEKNYEVEGILACPPRSDRGRLGACVRGRLTCLPSWTWNILFERAMNDLVERNPSPAIVSLALQDSFGDLLVVNNFSHHQDIIVLAYEGTIPEPLVNSPDIVVRLMQTDDLPQVTLIDNLAFEPIWRLSQDDLQRAYQRSS